MGAACRRSWRLAGVAGGLAALTRPLGVMIAPALAVAYLDAASWRPRALRRDALWLLLPVAGTLLFFGWCALVAGDPLAPLEVQTAFGRSFAAPWVTFFAPTDPPPGALRLLEQALLAVVLLLSALAFRRPTGPALAAYALLQAAPLLASGTLQSTARYELAMFPAFVVLGILVARRPWLGVALLALFVPLQTVLFALWCQLFPIL